jgi:hypothetical protein
MYSDVYVVFIQFLDSPLSLVFYELFFSTEVKTLGHEADNSPPTNAEVKNTWIYTSTPPYIFMVYCLIS